MMALPIAKRAEVRIRKEVLEISFRGKYSSAKEPVGLHDIIIVYSRHYEIRKSRGIEIEKS